MVDKAQNLVWNGNLRDITLKRDGATVAADNTSAHFVIIQNEGN